MNRPFVLVVAGLGVAIGAAAGYSLGATTSDPLSGEAGAPAAGRAAGSAAAARRDGTAGTARKVGRDGTPWIARGFGDSGAPDEDRPATATGSPGDGAVEEEDPLLEVERLETSVANLRQEWVELMGKPIEAPAKQADRFRGGSLSSAVGQAMAGADVGGEVEATDCSEHPCIIFGRLEGDEEDMEAIERSPALEPYESDVLTLLLWATSAEDPATAKMPEEGLFALAFYSVDDRVGQGDALDRRIRARVMEYWNTDRPGRKG